MMGRGKSRKLAVILHADVVDSTKLVRKNEVLAHERIQDTFRCFSGTIESYGGVTQELRGDALVASFDRASDAVCAAIVFQADNAELDPPGDLNTPVTLRIVIIMGEVVVADSTITGEGVVLAQRLEQVVKSGGVCIQGAAFETIPKHLPFEYVNLGDLSLKGFESPTRAYEVMLKAGASAPAPESGTGTSRAAPRISTKPSIAVLPFTNLGGNQAEDYFSDGITEDIITELSRFRSFLVIARSSSFIYRDKIATAHQIAEELNVKYIVEGSVRRSGNSIRVNAQLSDGPRNEQLWADKFDGELENVFELQDEVVARITGSVAGRIDAADLARAERARPDDMQAYDYFLRGQAMIYRSGTGDMSRARDLLTQALDLDTNYARAHAAMALAYCVDIPLQRYADLSKWLELAVKHAEAAYRLDKNDSLTQWAMSETALFQYEFDRSRQHIDRAIELNPNDADILAWACMVYAGVGQPLKGIDFLDRAVTRNPFHPDWYLWLRGFACCAAGLYEEAIENTDRIGEPNVGVLKVRAVAFARTGRYEDAQFTVERIIKIDPSISISSSPRMFKANEDFDHWIDGLRQAGLPE